MPRSSVLSIKATHRDVLLAASLKVGLWIGAVSTCIKPAFSDAAAEIVTSGRCAAPCVSPRPDFSVSRGPKSAAFLLCDYIFRGGCR